MQGAPSMTRDNCNPLARIDTQLRAKSTTPHADRTESWWAWVDHLLERRLLYRAHPGG